MKISKKKRLMILVLALCLASGSSMASLAAEPGATQTQESRTPESAQTEQPESARPSEDAQTGQPDDAQPSEGGQTGQPDNVRTSENDQTDQAQETVSESSKEAAVKTEQSAEESSGAVPAAQANDEKEDDSKKDEDGTDNGSNAVTNETPNTDIKVTPSDANALILMDAGAQSPRGVPGQSVEVILTLAVNREYLPSDRYVLRNITVALNIPKDSTKDAWPFNVEDAATTRHLSDMSYNSTAEIWYTLTISEFAKEGVYPVNFTVNATVWREDAVNGTEITEDVQFPMNTFVTVTENGDMSGVTSAIGPLEIAGRQDTAIASPTGKPGEQIVLSVPIVNKGQTLDNVTVAPVVTGDLDTFPFLTQDINYGRELGHMENGDRQTVDWPMTISPYATTGNKVVAIRATYEENGVYGECTFNAYVYVKDGYKEQSAPSLMVESYALYVNDRIVETVEAGSDVVLKVSLKNNAVKDTIYKTVATLKLSDANSLILTGGYSDAAYVRSIPAGQSTEIEYHITARASASVGPSAATLNLAYENQDVVQGTATSSIQIPIKQPMNLQLDTPVVYGNATQGEPVAVSLNMVNLGRSRAYNVSIVAMDGVSMQDAYFGGDILAAGTLNADFQVIPNKSGSYSGTLVVQYEDADGEQYMQNVTLKMDADPKIDEAAAAMSMLPEEEVPKAESGGDWWLIVLLLLLCAICGLLAWYFYRKKHAGEEQGLSGAEHFGEPEPSRWERFKARFRRRE